MPPKAKNPVIEVTGTHLVECGYTRKHVEDTLSKLTVVRRLGRARYYDMCAAIRALNSEDEKSDPDTRKKIAMAELAEEKVARLRGESVNKTEVLNSWVDLITRLRDAIKASEIPTLKDKQNLCKILKDELKRADGEIKSCAFYDQEDE